jgi:predicted ATP-dependent serine protease
MLEGINLQEGKMKDRISIVGSAGTGKSTLASNLAVSLAVQNLDVLYVSTEDTLEVLRSRFDKIRAAINSEHLGILYFITVNCVDEIQELVIGNIYDYVIIDGVENIDGYDQLNTDYDNKTKIIEIRRV